VNRKLSTLKFQPILKSLPWGGRKLEALFNKQLPNSSPYGESWEVVDLPSDQSVVCDGPWQGAFLENIVREKSEDLMGKSQLLQGRFPLLFKFIDAKETLSVQVHPDEKTCAKLGSQARPKTEAWYILHAEPEAKLHLGLRPGISAQEFKSALQRGALEELLEAVEVKTGDFVFIPAGLIHAIGKGIVLAEIQQVSDTTFRVFDWNRVGLDGRPRQLHIDEALASIKFDLHGLQQTKPPSSGYPGITSKYFSFEHVSLVPKNPLAIVSGQPKILACIKGAMKVKEENGQSYTLSLGETCLVPACTEGEITCTQDSEFLLIKV
jgi:mannose-6-phosphate isomerase